MAKDLFGTDGIRGVAGAYPLDPVTVHAIGAALAKDAVRQDPQPEIVIGMDTRESGPWLAGQIAGGLAAEGVRSRFAGVITTPGVAYLTRTGPFIAGVMISASHNPYQDNGIKVFGHSGFKLPDEEEHQIEQEVFRLLTAGLEPRAATLTTDPALDGQYLENLFSTTSISFQGVRLVLDCGNGAAFRLAPDLFRDLGAEVHTICAEPNGQNINQECGALHLQPLQRAVRERGADFGVAFDGDADRAIFVARSGKLVDGDAVLLIAACDLKSAGRLAGNLVVATVMSNLGLEKALEREGIRLLRTPVGDKYVLEEMVRTGAVLGGEQSGHVIFRQHATTGDGLLTALRVFEIAVKSGKGLDELTADLEIYPQRLKNVRVSRRKPLDELPEVVRQIKDCEAEFAGAGRVLVRFSGTEPLARVMVEGPNLEQVERFTSRIAGAIERELS
jgi:phosphoglucosamine mutase